MSKIEVNGSLTIDLKGKLYTVYSDIYYYDDEEYLKKGYNLVFNDVLYTVIKDAHGILPPNDEYYKQVDVYDEISDYVTADDVNALNSKIVKLDNQVVKSVNGVKPVNGNVTIDSSGGGSSLPENIVYYKDFDTSRQTIELKNYDSISGLDTSGTGYNLAMVSKWDVADFGANGIHMNLNSKDDITINDSEKIATQSYVDSKIQDVIGTAPDVLDTLGEIAEALQSGSSVVSGITSDLTTVKSQAQTNQDEITKTNENVTSLENRVGTLETDSQYNVKYQTFDETRKTIQLANYDSISGIDTSGSGHNLVMLSKWDVADFGSVNVHMNLNSTDGNVTINDDKQIATLDDISYIKDLGNFATAKEAEDKAKEVGFQHPEIKVIIYTVDTLDNGFIINNVIQTTTYQILWYRGVKKNRTITSDSATEWIEDNDVYEKNLSIVSDLFKLTTESTSEQISACFKLTGGTIEQALNNCLTKGFLIKDYALGGGISVAWSGQAFILTFVGQRTPKTQPNLMNILINATGNNVTIARNGTQSEIITAATFESQPIIATIQDSLNLKQDRGDYALKTDLSQYALTSSLSDYVQQSALESYALKTDLSQYALTSSLSDYATKSELETYALKTDLDTYATKSELGQYALTSSLSDYVQQSALESYALKTDLSQYALTSSLSDYATKSELETYATKEQLTNTDNKTVHIFNIPVTSLEDKVYEKQEILKWLGVTNESELKTLIASNKAIVLKFGTDGDTPKYQKFEIQYAGFESATQIKLLTAGVDGSTDKLSKYVIVLNLDGLIIEENTNVKATITSFEG